MSRSPGLIDRAEAQRLQLKFSGSNRPKRKKEREEINWRADPTPLAQPSCLSGGFKSIKHKWISRYLQSADPQAEPLLGAQGSVSQERRENPASLLSADLAGPSVPTYPPAKPSEHPTSHQTKQRLQPGHSASQAKENKQARPSSRQSGEAEPRQAESPGGRDTSEVKGLGAHKELGASFEEGKLERATKQARKDAESELAMAAELDRGAIAQKSLRKELMDAEILAPQHTVEKSKKKLTGKPSGDRQGKKRPLSPTTHSRPAGDQSTPQKRPQSATKRSESGQKRKTTETVVEDFPQGKRLEKRRRSGMSSQSKENVAENEGKLKRVLPPGQWDGTKQRNFFSTHSKAIDSHPLVQVMFVDGRESEHLGELDLNQLDSFRDLWLTIRSAFSARLPKGDFKLVYRDTDDDLMMHKSEPWAIFKSTATSLMLMST